MDILPAIRKVVGVKVLLTGADAELGRRALEHLSSRHDVEAADAEALAGNPGRLAGADALVLSHLFPGADAPLEETGAILSKVGLQCYRLGHALREAGVGRVIVIASLGVFDDYDADILIDEMWKPRPRPTSAQLAPYLAEQCLREFVREGPLCGVCLRFLPIGNDPERGTRLEAALHAMDQALALPFEPGGYRWHVFHVANSPCYLMRDATRVLKFDPQAAKGGPSDASR